MYSVESEWPDGMWTIEKWFDSYGDAKFYCFEQSEIHNISARVVCHVGPASQVEFIVHCRTSPHQYMQEANHNWKEEGF